MSNIFSAGEDPLDLDMSNGGTEVFVDVLMLAVSEAARRDWDFRFAALVMWRDQAVAGRGVVGFDLADLDWGTTPAEQADAKGFVLRVVDLALRRHRWHDLDYDPPHAERYLRTFRTMVERFDPATAHPDGRTLPDLSEIEIASCVRHRVSAPVWCVFCSRARGGEEAG